MNIDELPEQLEAFTERARDALTQEIAAARATLQKLKGEITDASKALGDIHNERKRVQAELSAMQKHLGQASTLATLPSEITKARADLKKAQDEAAKATTALERLTKERTDAERQVGMLRSEAQHLVTVKSQTEAALANMRARLA